jgi:hypothetical protein
LGIASRATAEGTEQAIRRISELQRESALRKSTLASIEETVEQVGMGVSGIQDLEGILTLPVLAEETIPMEVEQIPQLVEAQPEVVQPSTVVEAQIVQPIEEEPEEAIVPLKMRRAVKRTRVLQMDRRTMLSDTELKNRMKRDVITLKLDDDLNLAKIARTKGFNPLKKSNMLKQQDIFFLQPRLQRLNIANEFMSINMRTKFQTSEIEPAQGSLTTPERQPRARQSSLSIAEQVREATAGRSSLIDRRQASLIPPVEEDTIGKM